MTKTREYSVRNRRPLNDWASRESAYAAFFTEEARRGDSHAAHLLACVAARYIEKGQPLPAALRDYIAGALRAESVDKALGLKRGRGQKQPRSNYEIAVCSLLVDVRHVLNIPLKDNKKGEGAYSIVADIADSVDVTHPDGLPLTPDTVEKYWKKWRWLLKPRVSALAAGEEDVGLHHRYKLRKAMTGGRK